MSDIHTPKQRYKIEANYGAITSFVIVESHRTAKQLLKYITTIIARNGRCFIRNIDNNDSTAYALDLSKADSIGVVAVLEKN